MSFDSNFFSSLIKEKGLTTLELIEILKDKYNIDITIDTLKSYRRKNGKNATPTLEKLKAFSEILNTSIDRLSGNEAKIEAVKSIPIVATASCGASDINFLQDENLKAFVAESTWNKNLYAVIACGDSMINEIYDKDIVIIDPSITVKNGDIVFYKIDNECAIKIFYDDVDNYLINFIPYNSSEEFKTKTIRKDDEASMNKLTYHKVVQVISSKQDNRLSRLKAIGR